MSPGARARPLRTHQAQASQIHDVRIVEHPGADGIRTGRESVSAGIASLLEGARRRHAIGSPALRQRETVPAPVGHGIAGEGLQAGAIGAEAELAVAQGQAPGDLIPSNVVPRHQRVTVNGGLCGGRRRVSGGQRGQRRPQQDSDPSDENQSCRPVHQKNSGCHGRSKLSETRVLCADSTCRPGYDRQGVRSAFQYDPTATATGLFSVFSCLDFSSAAKLPRQRFRPRPTAPGSPVPEPAPASGRNVFSLTAGRFAAPPAVGSYRNIPPAPTIKLEPSSMAPVLLTYSVPDSTYVPPV